jgi:hypothetical protein
MKIWLRLPANIFITALLSGLSYVLLVSILNKWIGLGEPLWKGFLLQVLLHAVYTIIVLSVLVAPLFIILQKITSNELIANVITYTFMFSVLMLLYTFMLSVRGYWSGILLPSVIGVVVFYLIEYLTCNKSFQPTQKPRG